MKKINNNSIFLGLKILSFLTFSLLMVPAIASADYSIYSGAAINQPTTNSTWEIVYSISPSSGNRGVGTKTITITGEGFTPSSIARVNGSNRPTTFIDGSHLLMRTNSNDTYNNKDGFYITVYDGATGERFSNSAFFAINSNNVIYPAANTNTNNNNDYNSYSNTTNDTDNNYNNYSNTTRTDNDTDNDENYGSLASNAIFGSNSFLPSGLTQWVLLGIIILIIIILARKLFGAKQNYEETPLKHA